MNEAEPRAATLDDLMLIGLLGRMHRCDVNDVHAVDQALAASQPDTEALQVHRAMADCVGGDLSRARHTLEQHIEAHPGDDMAKVLLGASIVMSGDRTGRAWMDSVLVTSSDPTLREAALAVIQLADSGPRR